MSFGFLTVATHYKPRVIGVIMGALLVSACAGPANVDYTQLTTDQIDEFNFPPTIAAAMAYGHEVRSVYRNRIRNQMLLRKGVGLGAIAALAGIGYITTLGGSADLAYGLGSGVGIGLAATQLFTSDREQYLYAAGSVAIGCAMDAVAPLQSAATSRDVLKKHILDEPLSAQINNVDSRAAALSAIIGTSTTISRSRAVVAKSREVLAQGRVALLRLDTAGAELIRVVDQVQDQVTREVIVNQVNLAAFIASLSATLPAFAPTPTTAPAAAPADGIKFDVVGAAELEDATDALESATAELEAVVEFVAAAAAMVSIDQCSFDPSTVGGGFRLDPATPITVDATNAGADVELALSGGRPPYRFNWLGMAPPSTVKPELETGLGDLRIEVPKGSPGGTYAFRVSDVAKGVAFSQLIIQGPAPTAAGVSATPAAAVCEQDPKGLKKVQEELATLFKADGGIDVPGSAGKQPIVVDCKWGPVTEAALRAALAKVGVAAADIAAMGEPELIQKYKEIAGH